MQSEKQRLIKKNGCVCISKIERILNFEDNFFRYCEYEPGIVTKKACFRKETDESKLI